MEKSGDGYVVEAKAPHGFATIQIEYLPEAVVSRQVALPSDIKFLQLKYRSWTGIVEDFVKMSYPERIEPFRVTERHKFEVEVVFDPSFAAPNNTFVVFQHKDYHKARSAYHLSPSSMSVRVDFSDKDALRGLNGQYEMKIVGKLANLEKEWNIGSIVVELSTGAAGYVEPKEKGPLQGKELRHTFAPELVYAPIVVSLPVAVLLVVLLLVFLFTTSNLGVPCNNWPKSSSDKLWALIFIVRIL